MTNTEKTNNESGNSKENKADESVQLVVFELDQEEYAVEIKDLQEIIKIPDITPVPNTPAFIRGIFNLRGKIIVVVDLEKRFNMVRENEVKESNIIVAEVNDNSFGIVVDKVSQIINIARSTIQPTPSLSSFKIQGEYLKGVVVIDKGESVAKDANGDDSRLIILLDLPKMLTEKELLSLSKTSNANLDK